MGLSAQRGVSVMGVRIVIIPRVMTRKKKYNRLLKRLRLKRKKNLKKSKSKIDSKDKDSSCFNFQSESLVEIW